MTACRPNIVTCIIILAFCSKGLPDATFLWVFKGFVGTHSKAVKEILRRRSKNRLSQRRRLFVTWQIEWSLQATLHRMFQILILALIQAKETEVFEGLLLCEESFVTFQENAWGCGGRSLARLWSFYFIWFCALCFQTFWKGIKYEIWPHILWRNDSRNNLILVAEFVLYGTLNSFRVDDW